MAGKKRRASTTEPGHSKIKRAKFTLDTAKFPEVTPHGVALTTGTGDCGQLGLGTDIEEKTRPTLVDIKHEIVDVCAGGMHTVCLTKEGKVITFGANDDAALGRDTQEDMDFEPGEVELPGKAIQIAVGDCHSVALLEGGRVFAWGSIKDAHGNLGLTPRGKEKHPYEILPNVEIIKVACGNSHMVFLSIHGEVFTAGCAEQGQLGRVTGRSADRNARSSNNGQLAKLLQPSPISLKPSLKLHFDNIWSGGFGTYAKVAGKKHIYVFGLNNYNQLGVSSMEPQFLPKISSEFSNHEWAMIALSDHHALGLDTKGRVFVIGREHYGRLGLGKGSGDVTKLTEIPYFKDIKVTYVSCGPSTSFAVAENGDLYAWGMGTNNQLGLGDDEDRFEPTLVRSKQLADRPVFRVSCGGQHTIILASNINNNKGDAAQ